MSKSDISISIIAVIALIYCGYSWIYIKKQEKELESLMEEVEARFGKENKD